MPPPRFSLPCRTVMPDMSIFTSAMVKTRWKTRSGAEPASTMVFSGPAPVRVRSLARVSAEPEVRV